LALNEPILLSKEFKRSASVIVALASAPATIGHFLTGQRVPLEEELWFVIGGAIGFEIAMLCSSSYFRMPA
jgi:hypothetical protein